MRFRSACSRRFSPRGARRGDRELWSHRATTPFAPGARGRLLRDRDGAHSDGSYEDVLARITDGLAWSEGEDARCVSPTRRRSATPVTASAPSRSGAVYEGGASPRHTGHAGLVPRGPQARRDRRDVPRASRHAGQRRALRATRQGKGRTCGVPPGSGSRSWCVRDPRDVRRSARPLHDE